MDDKKLGLILLVVSGLVVLGFLGFRMMDANESSSTELATETTTETETSTNTDTESTPARTITLAELQTRNSADDCWTVISGTVYDITDYLTRHPGGDTILLACGGDGTSLFQERTTDEGEKIGSGTPHSSSASSQLSAYEIGDLVE
ncbi:MAG: cytochrome b5-like heme/steroid binding domain-containing protein [Candidatus Saccharimonadales bacterium]|nr:cytochrome b5-like heme/steroid binding domain-containing protein [Candidatus Saccharimonadales bacterium]